jgi:hypothetical protein
MSGTPIQNGLSDLLGLFKFLLFKPYDDARVFDEDIVGLARNTTLNHSIERLTSLLACIMIRRTKETVTITLPPRIERTVRLRFTPQEKKLYESIERPAADILENECNKSETSRLIWLSELQQIHLLRLVCNLGIAAASSHPSLTVSTLSHEDSAYRMLSAQLLMGDASCQRCLAILYIPQSSSQPDNGVSRLAYYSTCYKLFCASCATQLNFATPTPCDCKGSGIDCSLRHVSSEYVTPASTPECTLVSPGIETGPSQYLSTKVLALLTDIMANPDEKR